MDEGGRGAAGLKRGSGHIFDQLLCCTLTACSDAESGERRMPSASPAAVPPEPAATTTWSNGGGAGVPTPLAGGCASCSQSSSTALM